MKNMKYFYELFDLARSVISSKIITVQTVDVDINTTLSVSCLLGSFYCDYVDDGMFDEVRMNIRIHENSEESNLVFILTHHEALVIVGPITDKQCSIKIDTSYSNDLSEESYFQHSLIEDMKFLSYEYWKHIIEFCKLIPTQE